METNGVTIEERNTMLAIQAINQKLPDLELRDLFAMVALNGFLSSMDSTNLTMKGFARTAYNYADAMLEARKEK